MYNANTRRAVDLDAFQFMQAAEAAIVRQFGLSSLHSGGHVVRNEKGWRDNEKRIDYAWIVHIARSFVGWGGLFAIQFKEYPFRDQVNPAELIHGIFLSGYTAVTDIHLEQPSSIPDKIATLPGFALFDAGTDLFLDGISYSFHTIAHNITTTIELNNPHSAAWQPWVDEVWDLGKQLADKAGNPEMVRLFA